MENESILEISECTMNSFNGINVVGVTTTCATEGTTSGAEQLIPDEMFYYLLGVMILLCLYKSLAGC